MILDEKDRSATVDVMIVNIFSFANGFLHKIRLTDSCKTVAEFTATYDAAAVDTYSCNFHL